MNRKNGYLLTLALLTSTQLLPCPTCIGGASDYTPAFFSEELYKPTPPQQSEQNKPEEEENEEKREINKGSADSDSHKRSQKK
jgi:hypothetical protein